MNVYRLHTMDRQSRSEQTSRQAAPQPPSADEQESDVNVEDFSEPHSDHVAPPPQPMQHELTARPRNIEEQPVLRALQRRPNSPLPARISHRPRLAQRPDRSHLQRIAMLRQRERRARRLDMQRLVAQVDEPRPRFERRPKEPSAWQPRTVRPRVYKQEFYPQELWPQPTNNEQLMLLGTITFD